MSLVLVIIALGGGLALAAGLFFGAYAAAQSPGFYAGVAVMIFEQLKPFILAALTHSAATDAQTRVESREGTATNVGKARGHPGEH